VTVNERGDSKFFVEVREGRTPLGEDEPVFVFRGQDRLMLRALTAYAEACRGEGCSPQHCEGVDTAVTQIHAWQQANLTRTKLPD
jgi:hypothetical protein